MPAFIGAGLLVASVTVGLQASLVTAAASFNHTAPPLESPSAAAEPANRTDGASVAPEDDSLLATNSRPQPWYQIWPQWFEDMENQEGLLILGPGLFAVLLIPLGLGALHKRDKQVQIKEDQETFERDTYQPSTYKQATKPLHETQEENPHSAFNAMLPVNTCLITVPLQL